MSYASTGLAPRETGTLLRTVQAGTTSCLSGSSRSKPARHARYCGQFRALHAECGEGLLD
jgi:hypothetical protein